MSRLFNPFKIDQYIDGEMNATERQEFEQKMTQDTQLKQQVCALQQQKIALKNAYADTVPNAISAQTKTNKSSPTRLFSNWRHLAASLAVGVLVGLVLAQPVSFLPEQNTLQNTTTPINQVNNETTLAPQNFVVHLDTNQPEKLNSAVEKTRYLLDQNPMAKVQIVTNHEGVELFNANQASTEEVLKLLSQYQNLELMACRRTIERAQKQGTPLNLLSAVRADEPAVDEVVKRLKQGWTYIKI